MCKVQINEEAVSIVWVGAGGGNGDNGKKRINICHHLQPPITAGQGCPILDHRFLNFLFVFPPAGNFAKIF